MTKSAIVLLSGGLDSMVCAGLAREAGFTLLTLDAKRGEPAERLYRNRGWIAAGTIPGYALDPDGTPHDAVFLYKPLVRG